MSDRVLFTVGAVCALLAVAAGAFGAHALNERLTAQRLNTFEIAARYQMYHAFALLVTAFALQRWPHIPAATGWLFIAGILLFSGSLYLLALGGPRWLGAIAPLGGLSFLTGWALLAWGAFRAS